MLLNPNGAEVDSWQLIIDMEQVFDRMECEFLLSIMDKLRFHPTWISWIRICISTTSFSILLNGAPFGMFSPSRGLRQGDPLSPFLFILGTEVLSRLIQQQESISHLLFADDILIFGKATFTEAGIIKSCLDFDCAWSGQKVNTAKSAIHFSKNTLTSTINSIKGIIPFKNTSMSASYLGFPLFIGKSKNLAFQPIMDKVLN
jgi:hypothetical protein